MGREARCVGRFGKESGEGHLLLETHELIFRGPFRLRVPLAEIQSIDAQDGTLEVRFGGKSAHFEVGPSAAAWVKAVRQPKTVVDKLGLKPGQRMVILGLDDADLMSQAEARGVQVGKRLSSDLDHLFFAISSEKDLNRLRALSGHLKPDGALWVLRPKGTGGVSELATRAAGQAAGLVDVKIVAFSGVYTAEKFVIPVARRKQLARGRA